MPRGTAAFSQICFLPVSCEAANGCLNADAGGILGALALEEQGLPWVLFRVLQPLLLSWIS